jgi:hypothetical protein
VLNVAADGTTAALTAWALDVLRTEDGWEMFYSGTCPNATEQGCPCFIAYARSADGVRWTTYAALDEPCLTTDMIAEPWAAHCVCAPSVLRHHDRYMLYFTACADSLNDCQIGLALGKAPWSD